MEAIAKTVKKSRNTPALDLVFDRVIAMIEEDEPDRYPNGAAFLAADRPGVERTVKGCIAERHGFVLVFADGGEVIAVPVKNRVLATLRRLLAHLDRHERNVVPPGLASIRLPADYVVEVREPASPQ